MQLTLAVNIGTQDNKTLQLDKTAEGDTIDVGDTVADFLLKRGWATVAKPGPLKADPPKQAIQAAPQGLSSPPKAKADA